MDKDSNRRQDLLQFINRNLPGLPERKAAKFLEISIQRFHVHYVKNSTGYELLSASYTTQQLEELAAIIREA